MFKKKLGYLLSFIFPYTFSKVAYRVIINPREKIKKPRKDQLDILKEAKKEYFDFNNYKIQTYKWGEGKKRVLLIHGWEGAASSFHVLIDKLITKNYTVYAFDAPSHGFSDRAKNSIIDFIELLPKLIDKFNPSILISHSFGAVPATYSLSINTKLQVEIFIMFAPPNKFSDRVNDVIKMTGVSAKIKKPLIHKLESEFGLPFRTLNISDFIKKVNVKKALILHDIDDKVCSIQYSKEIHRNWPISKLEVLEGTGHSKILRANVAIEKVIKFISNTI